MMRAAGECGDEKIGKANETGEQAELKRRTAGERDCKGA
jgi:hypothetical protein